MNHGEPSRPGSSRSSLAALQPFSGTDYANSITASERNGTDSANQLPANSSPTFPSSENERTEILKHLEEVIESFRSGRISKTASISSIIRILGENSNVSLSESQKETTFDSYLTEILAIQSSKEELGGTQNPDEPANTDSPNTKTGDRRPSDSPESGEEDEDDRPSKKQRLLESDMPWYTPNVSSTHYSNPSCEETCRLLRAYNKDITKAKFFIKIAPNSPAGIPSSQWERILKGDSVDLNQIFASLHHVVPDEERTGRLGDTEISFGVSEAKKRVSTASEWTTAWRRASKAISFVFPHRRDKLFNYGDYIESEFAAKHSSSHHKLILYDIALRNEVAAGQHVLLTDFNKFTRLYSAIVMPDGIESSEKSTPKPTGKPRGIGKTDPCNKFNAGTCKNSDAECKYKHICKICLKPGHGDKTCSQGSK